MNRMYILAVCFLVVGVLVGNLLLPPVKITNQVPVKTDFCLLARHLDLFESRRFASYAYITSIQPHGYVLTNPACPDGAIVFSKRLDRQDHVEELDRKLEERFFGASVPVVFEGTLYRPFFSVPNFWFAARARLGQPGNMDRRIIIRAFNAIGEQKWDPGEENWKPIAP